MTNMRPEATISLFSKENPDLVIFDVTQENADSLTYVKQIREKQNEKDWVPIIFLSDAMNDTHIAKAMDAGGDDYIAKPFSEITLSAKINAMQRIADMRHKLIETTKKLEQLSSTDFLTNMPNRVYFEKNLSTALANAKRYKCQFSLLLMDLDNFKAINDNLGHHAGDLLLIEVSNRLRTTLRATDFIARMGGDEFAIILNDIKLPEDAGSIAKNIIKALQPEYQLEGHAAQVGCSIGIATYPSAGRDIETLTKNADIAMYKAKQSGKNNFQYFTNKFNDAYARRLSIESKLQFALDHNEFELYYQPQIHLRTNRIIGAEALIRWHNRELNNISPDEFIPLAEKSGFIIKLGQWVIEEACKQIAIWHKVGYTDLTFAINISPIQLTHDNLSQFLQKKLHEHSIPPNMVQLELTETAIMSYSAAAENSLHDLNQFGIMVSIDDFGTGYSSLSHLKRLPIHALKIDRSFVSDLIENPNDAMIIKSVLALAHNLNLNVVAEGIETKEQLHFLRENKCDIAQGYYFSKPLNIKETNSYFNEHYKKQDERL